MYIFVECNPKTLGVEENRLRFVLSEKYAGYYGYDATLLPRKAIQSTIMPVRNE